MSSLGLGEMFEGDSADTCAGTFPLKLMGGQLEGLACADQGARTPIGVSGFKKKYNYNILHLPSKLITTVNSFFMQDFCNLVLRIPARENQYVIILEYVRKI